MLPKDDSLYCLYHLHALPGRVTHWTVTTNVGERDTLPSALLESHTTVITYCVFITNTRTRVIKNNGFSYRRNKSN
jgi:hypothetical protein